MLDLLDVAAGMRVLDVGSGSAWTTALLGHLVGPGGCVVGVELDERIAAWGASNSLARACPAMAAWPIDVRDPFWSKAAPVAQ